MHVATTHRQYKGRVYTAHLLRRSYREDGKVKNETLANLSHLPEAAIEAIRAVLKGQSLTPFGSDFEIQRSRPHGAVAAVWGLSQRVGLPEILGPACPERDAALALIISQVVEPGSKASYSSWWSDTTLGIDLGVAGSHTDVAYQAMDWLYQRKNGIEAALVARHLQDGSLVCYDLSSSWMEGSHCPLAAFGHSKEGKRGKRQIEYGVVATTDGLPLAVEVFPGNTSDPTSFVKAVEVVCKRFQLKDVVFVGDRGMITQARIEELRKLPGLGWVTALRAPQIRALVEDYSIQPSLFDQTNLAEIGAHPDYPGERLVVCRNLELAQERTRKRKELLAATEADFSKVRDAVAAGRLKDPLKIGARVGRVRNQHKVGKHFSYEVVDGVFYFSRKEEAIQAEAALDGIYVIRTSVAASVLSAAETVATYKSLANLERDFRTMKTTDVEIRPIRHRLADRVRTHALICMLAAHLVWYLRRDWASLTFRDEDPPQPADPVAKAERSPAASTKAARRAQPDGTPVRPFQGLLKHLSTLTRNTCRVPGTELTVEKLSEPTPTQRRAFELLQVPVPLRLMSTRHISA